MCSPFDRQAKAHSLTAGQILERLKDEGIFEGKGAVVSYSSTQDGEVGTEGIVKELLQVGELLFRAAWLRMG